jgi:predicted CopG family antitoxin
MSESTTIKITKKLHERLSKEGKYGESMSDIIERLIK